MTKENKSSRIGEIIVNILNGMAQGLFSSLIIGLIIKQIGHYLGLSLVENFGQIAQYLTGPAIGIGVALSIGAPNLAIFACAVCGAVGAGTIVLGEGATFVKLVAGEPLGACIAAIAGAYAGKFIKGKTHVDIILVPMVTIIVGSLVGTFISPVVSALMNALGAFVNKLTTAWTRRASSS